MGKQRKIYYMNQNRDVIDWFVSDFALAKAAELGFELSYNRSCNIMSECEWRREISGSDALLTTWGSPLVTREMLLGLDSVSMLAHVGGSIAPYIADDVFDIGIPVSGSNPLMARSVAESALMLMLMGLRQAHVNTSFGTRSDRLVWGRNPNIRVPEDCAVGIWGFGDTSQQLLDMLKPFKPRKIYVNSSYLQEAEAVSLGLEKLDFDLLFEKCDVVFCLAGLTEKNTGRVGRKQLESMKDGAVLINVGRSRLIKNNDLMHELERGRITGAFDVYDHEPLAEDSPFYNFSNVILTPHNAGTGRDKRYLVAMLEELDRYFRGEPLRYEVTRRRVENMTHRMQVA